MNAENPYAPPVAPVADVGTAAPARPMAVTIAVQVSSVFLILTTLGSVASIVNIERPWVDGTEFFVGYLACRVIVPAVLLFKISRGTNWARWLLIGLFAIDVSFRASLLQFDAGARIGFYALIGPTLLQAVAFGLLFLPRSNAWFRAR